MFHGDPDNPKKNPHPTKRYELTATVDAPGPWDDVNGRVYFDVVSTACLRENKFLGVYIRPSDTFIDFEMTRVNRHTWKGYFHRDAMLDEDYYGRGPCHWDATSVSAGFAAQNIYFSSGSTLDGFLNQGAQTTYYKKSAYGDRAFVLYGAPGYSASRPEYKENPEAFFSITATVNEVAP